MMFSTHAFPLISNLREFKGVISGQALCQKLFFTKVFRFIIFGVGVGVGYEQTYLQCFDEMIIRQISDYCDVSFLMTFL